MSYKSMYYYFSKIRRERYEEQDCEKKNTKKERLIQALVKELGSSKDREKRIRRVVDEYL